MIRPYTSADAEAVLALNAHNVPEVGDMERAKLDLLAADAIDFSLVELDSEVAGALILLREGSTYGSSNYAYFCDRHEEFAYVDRVMLAPAARGKGWGPALYAVGQAVARSAGLEVFCCEVNTIPENPRSLRFHQIAGFEAIERRRPYGPDEEVVMLEKRL